MRNIMASTELPGNQYVTLSYGATIAEDILDRLVFNSHRIELNGDSMRKKKKLKG